MTEDELIAALRAEIIRQSVVEDAENAPWVDATDATVIRVDGSLDLQRLAAAILALDAT